MEHRRYRIFSFLYGIRYETVGGALEKPRARRGMIALVGHTAEYAPHGTRRSVPFCARAQTGIRRAGDRRSPRALECSPRFVEILLFGQVRRTVPSSGTMEIGRAHV